MPSNTFPITGLWLAASLALGAPAVSLHAAEAVPAGKASASAAPAPESASPAARAALEQLLGLNAPAQGASGQAEGSPEARTTTAVRAGETLDRIIRRTMGNTPFKDNLLQAAFVEANPRAYPNGSIQRLPVGTVINVPSASDLRRHLLRALGPDRAAALAGGAPPSASAHSAAPVAARPASAAALPAPPPKPDHRGWVRFPG